MKLLSFRKIFQISAVMLMSLICLFVLLETGLWLLGAVSRGLRDAGNRQVFTGEAQYKIVCFGESMTFRKYPKVLEEMLNSKYPEGNFFVVDEGLSRTRSNYIVNIFDSVVDREQPQAVVIMTGLGDEDNSLFARSAFEKIPFLYRIRTVRLFVFLAPVVRGALKYCLMNQESRAQISHVQLIDYAALDDECWKPVHVLIGQGKTQEAFLLFEKLYAEFPERVNLKNDYRFIMEKLYGPISAVDELKEMANKMFSLIEQGEWELDWVCVAFDLWLNAEAFYKKPQIQSERVRKFVNEKKAQYPAFANDMDIIWDNVTNVAEQNFCIEAEPQWSCSENVRRLLSQNKHEVLRNNLNGYLKKLLDAGASENEIKTEHEIAGVLGASGVVCLTAGNLSEAQTFFKRAERIRTQNIFKATCMNIRFLARHALERGILPVFVQYPVRGVEPLRIMLAPFADRVVIVDNGQTFRDGIFKNGFADYFIDSFAWDFGHTTRKGDKLLAENIMRSIAKRLGLEK